MDKITPDVMERFDRYLVSLDLKAHLLIVGGAVFQLMGKRHAATKDIDAIQQVKDDLRVAIADFAKKEDLSPSWINDRALHTVQDYLKYGWGVDGIEEVFTGMALTLSRPSIENLLLSKFCAIIDRQGAPQDLADIKSLGVSEAVFDQCAAFFIKKEKANGGDVLTAGALLAVTRKFVFEEP